MHTFVNNAATTSYSTACRLLDEGQLDEAFMLFGSLNFNELSTEEELGARVEAIQIAILQERYDEALAHAEAALLIAEHEPLIHHLAGRAMWQQGRPTHSSLNLLYMQRNSWKVCIPKFLLHSTMLIRPRFILWQQRHVAHLSSMLKQ